MEASLGICTNVECSCAVTDGNFKEVFHQDGSVKRAELGQRVTRFICVWETNTSYWYIDFRIMFGEAPQNYIH